MRFEIKSFKKFLSSYGVSAALVVSVSFIIVYAASTSEKNRPAFEDLVSLSGEKDLSAKESILSERILKNPDDISALLQRGIIRYYMGSSRYVDGVKDLEEARGKGCSDIKIFYYLASMYQSLGFYDFAKTEYMKYLNNRPDDIEARLMYAGINYLSGDYKTALSEYEKLNARYPRNGVVLENLALSRWKNSGYYSDVLEDMKKLGGEASCRADFVVGKINLEDKKYSDSAVAFENALNPDCVYPSLDRGEMYSGLAQAYSNLKNDAGAVNALQELLKINPDNDEARLTLSRLETRNRSRSKKNGK